MAGSELAANRAARRLRYGRRTVPGATRRRPTARRASQRGDHPAAAAVAQPWGVSGVTASTVNSSLHSLPPHMSWALTFQVMDSPATMGTVQVVSVSSIVSDSWAESVGHHLSL